MITGNTAELDEAIRSKILPYLYNGGEGKWIHCAHLACLRNRDRPKTQQFDDDEPQVLSSNPFTPGTSVNSDAELILELWRDGRLEEYYAKPKQVSDRDCNMLSGTTL
mgnify:CR=1 FL=1